MRELLQEELQAVCPLGIELDREIGKGSYGRVYSLKDCNRVFKVLDPAMSRTGKTLELKDYEQFKKELEYAEKITHLKNPYLLPIQGIYSCAIQPEDDEKRMIFMMLMPRRKNLEELAGEKIAAGAKPCEDDIIRIVSDLCRGLESLHQEKVVIEGKVGTIEKISIPGPLIHGDIKPGNVFVHDDSDGVSYYQLGDFGACFRCGNGWIPGQKLYTNFHYTAPEIHDKDIGPGYDVFSLGFMLYWWMNGWQHPEEARKARFQADFEQKFRLKNMSQELWQVFMKATKEAPQNRYASAAQLREALENARKARNARIQEKEKKDIEIASVEKGKGEGKKELLITEAKIAAGVAGGIAVAKGISKLLSSDSKPKRVYGELQYAAGVLYKGEVCKGKADGSGSLYFSNGSVFTGKWNMGQVDENLGGAYVFADGSRYSGQLRNGYPGGNGVYTSCSGQTIDGEWRYVKDKTGYTGMLLNDLPYGQGDYIFPDGSKYTGEFWNGFTEGMGNYTACDGIVFSGRWSYVENAEGYSGMLLDGEYCGWGRQSYPTEGCYCGEFKNGFPDGRGSYTTKDGSRFAGNWDYFRNPEYQSRGLRLNGQFCGYADVCYTFGGRHLGEFKDGEPCGIGVYIARDGTRLSGIWAYQTQAKKQAYSGMLLNGMKNGWGKLMLNDGGSYAGEFRDNRITGWGKHLDKKGNLICEGYWEDGTLIGD